MFQVFTLTAAPGCAPHSIGVTPGPLPPTVRAGDTITVLPHTFDALDAADAYKKQLERHYNLLHDNWIVVYCEQTGQIFPSARNAALSIGGTVSAMSNHLRNKPGHRSVKGHTFRKIPISIAEQLQKEFNR